MRAPVLCLQAWCTAAALLYVPSLTASAQGRARPDLSPTAAAYTLEAPALLLPSATAASLASDEDALSPESIHLVDPELPGLERRADGSYRFHGTNFKASISKDGQVTFRDTYIGFSRKMQPLPPPPRDRAPSSDGARHAVSTPWLALQFRIDLQGYLEKRLGTDPYLSERRWFLERTRELREGLATRAAQRSLRRALLKIWSDAGLSLAARKRETFALWNHAGDDETGRSVRAMVQAFVRERCPAQSSCAYRPSELKHLNEARLPREAFSPYDEPRRMQPEATRERATSSPR